MLPDDRPFVLTFDIDWAPDAVLADTIDLLVEYGASATLFATHETTLLDGLGDAFEVGIHPNFNPLLAGQGGPDARARIDALLDLFPGAVGMRSHSTVNAPVILEHFAVRGGLYSSNLILPWPYPPYYDFGGLLRMPYAWADNVHLLRGGTFDRPALELPGWPVRVVAFHPAHVFLDTERPERFAAAHPDLQDVDRLARHRNDSAVPGARHLLIDLLERVRAGDIRTMTLAESARETAAAYGPCPYRHPDEMKP